MSRSPACSLAPSDVSRVALINDLRTQISRIEGGMEPTAVSIAAQSSRIPASDCWPWTLGVAAVDRLLGRHGLDVGGIHEIRSNGLTKGVTAAAATAARRAFALALGVRRLQHLHRAGPILWCLPLSLARETGAPYSRGLAALGLDTDNLVIVTPRRARDVLWVLEEAVRAPCLSLVLGEVGGVQPTAARRLSLASAVSRTPCLLVPPVGETPMIATATRWRVAPRLGTADPFDPQAPGARGFQVALERCRADPLVCATDAFDLEWYDGARCFRMAAAIPDRASAPGAKSGSWSRSADCLQRIA